MRAAYTGIDVAIAKGKLYVENGKVFLFYTLCGEQGIAAAEITNP